MIHLSDVIQATDYLLNHNLSGVYNLADDAHPSQKELYQQISAAYHLRQIQWNPNLSTLKANNMRVSNHKIKATGYTFLQPERVFNC